MKEIDLFDVLDDLSYHYHITLFITYYQFDDVYIPAALQRLTA